MKKKLTHEKRSTNPLSFLKKLNANTLFDLSEFIVEKPQPIKLAQQIISESKEVELPELGEIKSAEGLYFILIYCHKSYKNALCENLKKLEILNKTIVNFDEFYFREYLQNFINLLNEKHKICSKITIGEKFNLTDFTGGAVGTSISFIKIKNKIIK